MKKCKITVMRITRYEDLMAQYENPMEAPCNMEVGQVFVANGWKKPENYRKRLSLLMGQNWKHAPTNIPLSGKNP